MAPAVREQGGHHGQSIQRVIEQEAKGRKLLEEGAVPDRYAGVYKDKDICRSFNGKTKFDSKVGLCSEVT